MKKNWIAAALSLALVVEAPGLAGYQAFAATAMGPNAANPGALVPSVGKADLPEIGAALNPDVVAPMQGSLALPPAASADAVEAAPAAAAAAANVVEALSAESAASAPDAVAPAQALEKIYDGVGPQERDRAVFHPVEGTTDGPVFHLRYHPKGEYARPAPRLAPGHTPVHILVGTGAAYGRGWIAQEARDYVSDLAEKEIPGLQLLVIDKEEHRPAGVKHFIAADISDFSPENVRAVTRKVLDYVNENKLTAMGANSFNQGFISWPPLIQELIRDTGNNPGILVNPPAAVNATTDKFATRTIVGEQVKHLYWPAAVSGTVDDPNIIEKSVDVFRRVAAETPSGKVILKLATSAGKAGLRVAGISTVAEMREKTKGLVDEIVNFWRKDPKFRELYIPADKTDPVRILIEGLIDRVSEYDIELTISLLEDGTLDVLAFIIGNANPGELEKGYLFGVDGLLSAELQRRLIVTSVEATVAAWARFEGRPFGNFHVEEIFRGDPAAPQPALVEINATRPIGGTGIMFAREWDSQIRLVRGGLRAALGLSQIIPTTQPKDSLHILGIMPQTSGTLTKLDVPEDMPRAKLSQFGQVQSVTRAHAGPVYIPMSAVGDKLEGAETPHPDGIGGVAARGKDAFDAIRNVLGGLSRVQAEITTPTGVRPQKGDEEHSLSDYVKLPQVPAELSPRAETELEHYAEAQIRWTPIFKVYYPLFSALMNAMGGLAAIGIGRIGYTLALAVSSPFASVVASRLPVRSLLKYTWAVRVGIWAGLVPLAVLALPTGGVALTAAIFALNFLDGLMVSFSHSVDWDAFGMDELAKQRGFSAEMTPAVRGRFNARFSAWSSKAQMIFPLVVAGAVTVAAQFALPIQWAFLAGMAGIFAVQGVRAIASINKLSTDVKITKSTNSVWKDFKEGVSIIRRDRVLAGLVGLDSLERALGDGLFMVAYPLLGLLAIRGALHLDDTGANLVATILVSILSFAGMKASQRFRERLKRKAAETDVAADASLKAMFPMMFVAGLTTLSIPAAYVLLTSGFVVAGLATAAAGAVAFMFAFKPAQLSVMTMMQGAGAAHEGSTRIAGLSSSIQMLVSGVSVWALGTLFPAAVVGAAAPAYGLSFLAVSGFFIAVGSAYWAIWPRLVPKTPPSKK